jgi:hypothetical protein
MKINPGDMFLKAKESDLDNVHQADILISSQFLKRSAKKSDNT